MSSISSSSNSNHNPVEWNTMDMTPAIATSLKPSSSKITSKASTLPAVHYHSFTKGRPCQDQDCLSKIIKSSKNSKLSPSKLISSCTYVRLGKLDIDWNAPPPKQCCNSGWASRQTWDPKYQNNLLNREVEELSEEEEIVAEVDIPTLKKTFGGENLPLKDLRTGALGSEEPMEEALPIRRSMPVRKKPSKASPKGSKLSKKDSFLEEYFYAEYHEKGIQAAWLTKPKVDCPLCGLRMCCQQFANHMVISHLCYDLAETEDLMCLHCFKKFETEEALNRHFKMVNDVTELSCMICLVQFESESLRMEHMRTKHYRFTMPYQCQLCKYSSSLPLQFSIHFDHAHTEAYCPCCLKVFPTSFGLHQLSNRSLQSHVGATMKFFMEVRLHMTRHMSVKDMFACDQCSLSFVNSDDLNVHKKIGHVCYVKQLNKLKTCKSMVLGRFLLTEEQKGNLTAFGSEAELSAALGPTVTFDQAPRLSGSSSNPRKSISSLVEEKSEDVIMKEVDEQAHADLLFMTQALDQLFISKHDRGIDRDATQLNCNECLQVVYETASEKKVALAKHYSQIPLACQVGNCSYSTFCRTAFRAHDHAFLLSKRNNPHVVLDPTKVSRNHKSHFSVCRNCGVRFRSIAQLCVHLYKCGNHRACSQDCVDENDDGLDEEGEGREATTEPKTEKEVNLPVELD